MFLPELFTFYGSDKNTRHSYGPVYERLLMPIRDTAAAILELGVLGGGSVRAWQQFFPNAVVVGIDNNPDLTKFKLERVELHTGDVTDADTLNRILGDREFDLIVDDASHWDHDQNKSWEILWPRVKIGGYYVIEDVQWVHQQAHLTGLGAEVLNLNSERANSHDNVLAIFTKQL